MSSKTFIEVDLKAEQARIDSIQAKFLEVGTEEDELKYQTIIQSCREFNTTFHDDEFPLTDESIGKQLNKNIQEQLKQVKTLDYLPPHMRQPMMEFVNNAIKIQWARAEYDSFWFDYNHFHVYQNSYGNCGLVASLSAISAHNSLIKFLFRDFEISPYGVYQVKLCLDGEWKIIVIDDYIPSLGQVFNTTGCYAGVDNDMIWASLIEKALAKLHGSYDIQDGFCDKLALTVLTGIPAIHLIIKTFSNKRDELWEILKDASAKKFPMVCANKVTGEIDRKDRRPDILTKPHFRHAFTIMTCFEFGSNRVLKIRNPWGHNGEYTFNGKWTTPDGSWEIYKNDTENCGYWEMIGSFWIDFDELFTYFFDVSISRYRDCWSEIRLNMAIGGLYDDSQKMIKISVSEECDVCVSAVKPKYHKQRYHTWISIHRSDPSNPEKILQVMLCEPIDRISEDVHLPPGDYIMIVSNFYESSKKEERVVAIHSSRAVTAQFCTWNPNVLVNVYQNVVAEKGEEIPNKKEEGASIKKYSSDTFVIVMAENCTDDKYLHVDTRCSKVEKSWLSRGDVFNHHYEDVIPPKSRQILILMYRYKWIDQKGFPMKISYYLSNRKKKFWRLYTVEHFPSIAPTDYVHQTVLMN
ncbi:hypothetical protein GCK72_003717 [Caenorhabditis remanei]|uniref:Calpain catalytic domain-containing protein n=1 Tax=Caenorhabditis remanei TaxID=31234 RepID=A0A6A5HBJ9_CAERE|nr:hypothetical protein GCK72_003717 [Caenorhabditis remanei]KAF1763772.1 hypothetical protein GCK72_003717 [Caenorhabditis remanei]